jgi:hypothetical protein
MPNALDRWYAFLDGVVEIMLVGGPADGIKATVSALALVEGLTLASGRALDVRTAQESAVAYVEQVYAWDQTVTESGRHRFRPI